MPLTRKGRKVMRSMKEQYGEKGGERVFYSSRNKGKIEGVDRMKKDKPKKPKGYGKGGKVARGMGAATKGGKYKVC